MSKLAAIATQGHVCGIDYSEESVAVSQKNNACWIDIGRVEIRQGSVSQLPFPDDVFDIVTAVETHYFWLDLAADTREVFRVLRPGGALILIAAAQFLSSRVKHQTPNYPFSARARKRGFRPEQLQWVSGAAMTTITALSIRRGKSESSLSLVRHLVKRKNVDLDVAAHPGAA